MPLCSRCYHKLELIIDNTCRICGRPLHGSRNCRHCLPHPGYPDFARACVKYGAVSSKIVHSFKYRGRENAGMMMASMMANLIANSHLFEDAQHLAYIPFSFIKKYNRYYNHSQKLAEYISGMTGLEMAGGLLRAYPSLLNQSMLPQKLRMKRGRMFYKGKVKLSSSHVILIDDVLTSGITAYNASRVLKENNEIEKVSLVTFAS